MTGAVLTGYRHDLQVYPSRLSGHIRAVLWALIAAGFLALAEVFW